MSNAPDNRDPGEEQQPRFNLTVSLSSGGGETFPHRSIIFPAHLVSTHKQSSPHIVFKGC